MGKEKLSRSQGMLIRIVSVMFALSVVAGTLALWMAADQNKDNAFCREIADPSAAQRLWIFDCAPNFGNSFEIFGTYFLTVFVAICAVPFAILLALTLLRKIGPRRDRI